MLKPSLHTVPISLFDSALTSMPTGGFKQTINCPTGNFFYDPWELKPEFKNTVWENILATLAEELGEARLITLEPGTCYYGHADIDDRWHLSLSGSESYLIDLNNQHMHKLEQDQIWYSMNAGCLHSAANFGQIPRVQLVVRKLLQTNSLITPVTIKLEQLVDRYDYRYLFDRDISPWLNRANKQGIINKFSHADNQVSFDIEEEKLSELEELVSTYFRIIK